MSYRQTVADVYCSKHQQLFLFKNPHVL